MIVGAGAAGLGVAEAARSLGHEGSIVLVGDEPHEPYDRPPLSKQFLSGAWEADRLPLRDRATLDGLGIDLRLGSRAGAVDSEARSVTLADGMTISYDALVVATGVTANRLPFGHGLSGVHVLRDLADAARLREGLLGARSLVVIGAGFLGAEVAAVARELDVAVALVDPLPFPLVRVLGSTIGAALADKHRAHGVDLRCGVGVRDITGEDGRVSAVELDDGTRVEADVVLVAIGSKPAVDWLAGSSVPLGRRGVDPVDGVLCDGQGRALPDVYAAGDVAAWWDARVGFRHRVEHRLTAAEQGRIVAQALLRPDEAAPEPPVPYFWSDQYDLKLQVYGLPGEKLDFAVVEGDIASGRFIAVYGRDGVLSAALGCGMPRQLRAWRQAVAEARPWPNILEGATA